MPDATDDFTDIALIGSNELWLSTAAGKLLYSANGGQNWAMVDSGGIELGAFASLVVNPAGDAWIGGSYGAIHQFAGPPGNPEQSSAGKLWLRHDRTVGGTHRHQHGQ